MHPAPLFHTDDQEHLTALMRAHPFALLIGVAEGRAHVAHAPILVDVKDGALALRFHLSRENPACTAIAASGHALIVFSGAHDYISPDWYGLPDQVGTWNYLSCEAEGPCSVLESGETARMLDDLSAHFEAGLAPKTPWTRDNLADGKFERMLGSILAFRLVPKRLEGVKKLAQYKSAEARAKVIAALGAGNEIAAWMERDD